VCYSIVGRKYPIASQNGPAGIFPTYHKGGEGGREERRVNIGGRERRMGKKKEE
jgi:hypothetical protein